MGNNVDDFLRDLGMTPKRKVAPKKKGNPKWEDMLSPSKVAVILGKKGSGKSALAYYLAEKFSAKYNLIPTAVNFPPEKQSYLPPDWDIKSLEDIRDAERACVLIDEGTTMIRAGSTRLEELVKGLSALARQRDQIIIFIFHASSDVGSRILRGVDVILVKEPSQRQIQFGSKDNWMRELLTDAKTKFEAIRDVGSDPRRFVYIDCEEPEFRGILRNELSSFWTESLSKAWAGVSILGGSSKCKKCGQPAKQLIGGLCPSCYKSKLEPPLLRVLERKAYQEALKRGEISLSQMKEGVLDSDPPS